MKKPIEIQITNMTEMIDPHHYCTRVRELILYDIPARYTNDKVVKAIKSLGYIKKFSFKRQRKYQMIKVSIHLEKAQKEAFCKKQRSVKLVIGSEASNNKECIDVRWFAGTLTVKEMHELCKWKAYSIRHSMKIFYKMYMHIIIGIVVARKYILTNSWCF